MAKDPHKKPPGQSPQAPPLTKAQKRVAKLIEAARDWGEFAQAGGRVSGDKGKYVNLPVRLVEEAAANKASHVLLTLLKHKMGDGNCAVIPKRAFPGWKRAVALGWLRESKDNVHPLPFRAWDEPLKDRKGNMLGKKGRQTVKFDTEMLRAGVAALYYVLQEYMMRVHPKAPAEGRSTTEAPVVMRKDAGVGDPAAARLRNTARKPGGRPRKDKRAVPLQSAHAGGIALSLMAGKFERTKVWASQMRRKLEEAGMCLYVRRWERVGKDEYLAGRALGEPGYGRKVLCLPDGTPAHVYVREVTSMAVPSLLLCFRYMCDGGGV